MHASIMPQSYWNDFNLLWKHTKFELVFLCLKAKSGSFFGVMNSIILKLVYYSFSNKYRKSTTHNTSAFAILNLNSSANVSRCMHKKERESS